MNGHYLSNIFLRTTDLHGHFSGKSVFISGSSGFFGRWFLSFFRHLKVKGIDVRVSGGSRRNLLEESDLYSFDVCNWRTYPDSLLISDFILNCSGDAGGGDLLTHSHGGIGLLERMKQGGRLLQFSSGAVSLDNWTEYAKAKAIGEGKVAGKEGVQIARPFATVGPGFSRESHFAIPTFLRRASVGLPLEVAPGVTRSFAHICDVVVQCLHVMIHGDGRPYEVGSNNPISMEEAARLVSDNVTIVEKDYPTTSAARHYSADLTRVRNQFNLGLDFDSKSAILDTVNSYFAK